MYNLEAIAKFSFEEKTLQVPQQSWKEKGNFNLKKKKKTWLFGGA